MWQIALEFIVNLIASHASTHPNGVEGALADVAQVVSTIGAQHAAGKAVNAGTVLETVAAAAGQAIAKNNPTNTVAQAGAEALETPAALAGAGVPVTAQTVGEAVEQEAAATYEGAAGQESTAPTD